VDTLVATGQVTGETINLADPLIWNTAADLARAAGQYTP
jgi:hypothetical protein